MCKRKAGKIFYVSNALEKVNADPNEIDINTDDSDLEDNDHIEAIEEKNPQISFAAALQILDQLQDFASSFADTKSVSWLLLLKSYKT